MFIVKQNKIELSVREFTDKNNVHYSRSTVLTPDNIC